MSGSEQLMSEVVMKVEAMQEKLYEFEGGDSQFYRHNQGHSDHGLGADVTTWLF